MRLSLFARYWLALGIVATAPILVAGIVEGWFVYRSGYVAASTRQLLEARQAAFQIERSVLPVLDRLALTAAVPWDYATASDDEQVKEMRRVIREHPIVARIQRVSAAGEVLAFVALDGKSRTLGPPDVDQLARARDAASFAGPILVRGSGTSPWSVGYIERGTRNALVADLRTDVVNDLVVRSSNPGGNFIVVTDSAGKIIAHPDLSPAYSATPLQNWSGWNRVVASAGLFRADTPSDAALGEIEAHVSEDPSSGNDWFAAYRRISKLDWVVFALTPAAGLHTDIRAAVLRTGVILLTANMLALLLALALAGQMSRPLRSLMRASQRVAHGDRTARAEVVSQDDIGRLSEQFNAMVEEINQSYQVLEQKVAEKTAALERANRHKSEFLAQMSHELRTPLNAVIGASDVLLNPAYFGALNDKQAEYLRDINASGQHLLALINDLLDLAKIEAGRMDLSLAPVAIQSLLEASVILVRERAQAKEIALESNLGEGVDTWVLDGRRIKQVLVNLLSNAVKFTPEGGRVRVEADLAQMPDQTTGLRFAVSDTGAGIAAEDLANLFHEYEQLKSNEDAAVEGTGLGLAVSQRIVRLHGSEIRVESEVGKGATFWFALPPRPWPAS